MDPDPGSPKTCGSGGSGSGSETLICRFYYMLCQKQLRYRWSTPVRYLQRLVGTVVIRRKQLDWVSVYVFIGMNSLYRFHNEVWGYNMTWYGNRLVIWLYLAETEIRWIKHLTKINNKQPRSPESPTVGRYVKNESQLPNRPYFSLYTTL